MTDHVAKLAEVPVERSSISISFVRRPFPRSRQHFEPIFELNLNGVRELLALGTQQVTTATPLIASLLSIPRASAIGRSEKMNRTHARVSSPSPSDIIE